MVVRFGGLADGQQTTTGSDGTFLLILTVPPTVSGDVTAVATCRDGHTSNTAAYYINNYYGPVNLKIGDCRALDRTVMQTVLRGIRPGGTADSSPAIHRWVTSPTMATSVP